MELLSQARWPVVHWMGTPEALLDQVAAAEEGTARSLHGEMACVSRWCCIAFATDPKPRERFMYIPYSNADPHHLRPIVLVLIEVVQAMFMQLVLHRCSVRMLTIQGLGIVCHGGGQLAGAVP